jgi:hypothetical protein
MNAPATITEALPAHSSASRHWLWPVYPLTAVVAGAVLAAALLANVPAIHTARVSPEEGADLIFQYEHGWPARYVTRPSKQAAAAGIVGRAPQLEPAPVWTPWHKAKNFRPGNLLANVAIWSVAIVLLSIGAQYWRSQRRAAWQLKIADLFGLVTIAAATCGWMAFVRFEAANEQALIARAERSAGSSMAQKTAAVPAYLPKAQQEAYRGLFERVVIFNSYGQSDVACGFRHLRVLRECETGPEFRKHLASMPQLEVLYLWRAKLPYFDVTRQATILRDLPPMPQLRVVHLADSTATDADMAWLAKCPRLAVVTLSNTGVGDEGIRHLRALPRLRSLYIEGPGVTDEGCRRLAEFPALEELVVASRNVHDAGVRDLAGLKRLRRLGIGAAASAEAFADLQQALPECEIHEQRYR